MRYSKNVPLDTHWDVDPILGCWLWKAAMKPQGYGQLNVGKQTVYAHIFVYQKYKGRIPTGLHLDHFKAKEGCPRHCVNPDHLEPVKQGENTRRGNRTILTAEKVKEIKERLSTESNKKLAICFHVNRRTIGAIREGRSWIDI